MRKSFVLFSFLAAAAVAHAQTFDEYLKLRAKQHIVQPTPAQALDSLTGPSIIEIQSLIQGVVKTGDHVSLLVQRIDGETLTVDCNTPPPAWMQNGTVQARLLLRVTRAGEYDPLQATLIASAPEDAMEQVDQQYWKGEEEKAKAAEVKRKVQVEQHTASRDGSGLRGWIGRPPASVRSARGGTVTPEKAIPIYAAFIRKENPRVSRESALEIADSVIRMSARYGVEPRLVMAVLIAESDFNIGETSRTGAMGLGQLMPDTAQELGVRNPYDTRDNLEGSIRLLRSHLDQYTTSGGINYELALAAYNAGPGAVRKYGGTVPPYAETQHYVVKVMSLFHQLGGS